MEARWLLQRLLGMLQTLIRLFLPLILETDRSPDCMPPAAACSAVQWEGAVRVGRRGPHSSLYPHFRNGRQHGERRAQLLGMVDRAPC
jgi:hypothetical protein